MNRRKVLGGILAMPVVASAGLGAVEPGWEICSTTLLPGSRAFYVGRWVRASFESFVEGDIIRREIEPTWVYKMCGHIGGGNISVEVLHKGTYH